MFNILIKNKEHVILTTSSLIFVSTNQTHNVLNVTRDIVHITNNRGT